MRTLKKPTLILGAGIQASGKATILRGIAAEVRDTIIINRDVVINSFIWERGEQERATLAPYKPENGTINTRNSEHYSRRVCLQSLYCLLALGIDFLKQGKHPMLEGGYTKELTWGYVEKIVLPLLHEAFGNDAALKIIFPTASKETIEKRIRTRGEPHDLDVLKIGWEKFWERERTMPPEHLENTLIIPTDKEINWEAIFKFLEE